MITKPTKVLKGTTKPCAVCAKPIYVIPSRSLQKFCSYACRDVSQKSRPTKKPRRANDGDSTRTLDNIASKIVRERDAICLRCGTTERLQASHVLPKGIYNRLRYDLDNIKSLCFRCHLHWWHKNPLEASIWFEESWPGLREVLQARAMIAPKVVMSERRTELAAIFEHKNYQPYASSITERRAHVPNH